MAVVELVAELQIGSFGNRFAVSHLHTVVAAASRSGVVSVVYVVDLTRLLRIGYSGSRQLLTVTATEPSCSAESDIAPVIAQTSVQLQYSVDGTVVAVCLLTALVGVDHNIHDVVHHGLHIVFSLELVSDTFKSFHFRQRVIGIVVRIFVECSRTAV